MRIKLKNSYVNEARGQSRMPHFSYGRPSWVTWHFKMRQNYMLTRFRRTAAAFWYVSLLLHVFLYKQESGKRADSSDRAPLILNVTLIDSVWTQIELELDFEMRIFFLQRFHRLFLGKSGRISPLFISSHHSLCELSCCGVRRSSSSKKKKGLTLAKGQVWITVQTTKH